MANLGEKQTKPTAPPPAEGEDAPPSYEAAAPGPSSEPSASSTRQTSGPTPKDPFNFPSSADLPPYAETNPLAKPIAIPQTNPSPSAPFLPAYPPTLLTHGITPATFHAFTTTLSAFLSASVPAKALAHATDMAHHLGTPPVSFGKTVARNAKSVGTHIRDSAKRGNVLGAAVGVVGGALSLTVGTAFGAVGAVLAMPGAAVGAVARKPKTPRERAAAYVAVANREWLGPRGWHAVVLGMGEMCQVVGAGDGREVREEAGRGTEGNAAGQMKRLEKWFCELEVEDTERLELGANTLWLVVKTMPREGGPEGLGMLDQRKAP